MRLNGDLTEVDLSLFSNHSDDAYPRCPDCGFVLVMHVPDVQRPERLLGTCDDCHSWHLFDEDRNFLGTIDLADGESTGP